MSFSLRPYQVEAVEAVEQAWQSHDSTLLVMATGLGKTEIFTELARRHATTDSRSLIICPQLQLIGQAADKIRRRTGLDPDIEQRERYAYEQDWLRSPYIVASKQTLTSKQRSGAWRFERLQGIGQVIVDEAHLSATKQYAEILDHFRRQGARVLGVTASPQRADGRALGQLYQSTAFQYDIREAIQDGWLVPAQVKTAVIQSLNLSSIDRKGKDFSEAALAEKMEDLQTIAEIAMVTAEATAGKQTAIFCASVEEARRVAERLTDHYGVSAGWICADPKLCPPKQRAETLDKFHDGAISHLANVGILTTGWDYAGLEAIVQARPTKSLALYTQIFGRGTRPLPGVVDGPETPEARREAIAASAKPSWLMVDLVDTSLEQKLRSARDVLAGRNSLAGDAASEEGEREPGGEDPAEPEQESQEDATREEYRRWKAEGQVSLFDVDPFTEAEGASMARKKSGARWLFGKHKGKLLGEIPTGYLEFFLPKLRHGWLKTSTEIELRRRKAEGDNRGVPAPVDRVNDLFREAAGG